MPEPSCPLRGRRLPPSSAQECGGARRPPPPPPALCLPALTPPPPAARKPALAASAPAARWNPSGGGRAPRERPAVPSAAAGRDAALPGAEVSKRRAAVSRRRAARLAPPIERRGPGAVPAASRPPLNPARALPLRLGPALPQKPPLRRCARSCRTGRETRDRACADAATATAACSLGAGRERAVTWPRIPQGAVLAPGRTRASGGGGGAERCPAVRRCSAGSGGEERKRMKRAVAAGRGALPPFFLAGREGLLKRCGCREAAASSGPSCGRCVTESGGEEVARAETLRPAGALLLRASGTGWHRLSEDLRRNAVCRRLRLRV